MVLHKKSDYGFNGYRAPEVPQTSRPIRKKRSNLRRNLKADPMGAIDMLATVAGMLLDEKPSLGKDIAKMENNSSRNKSLGVDGKPINAYQQCYEASCDEGGVVIGGDRNGQTTSGGSVMSGGSSSFVKAEETKYGSEEVVAMVDGKKIGVKFEDVMMGKSTVPLEDGDIHMDGKPPALVSSDSSADVPSCRDNAISCNNSSPLSIKDGKERDQHGDDEENSSGCTHPGPIASEPSRFEGDKRRRKVCNSKFWKVGPTLLKDGGEFSSRDVDSKFRSRKMCCRRQRTQRPPFKKGKLQERNIAESKPVVENGVKVEGSNLTENGMPMPSLVAEPKTSAETGDSRVKLRIKSFKIPELFIEMPESATVGCLKRTVLETVTEMVENGLGVGVILQGKEVRDDSRTLEQTGITHEKKLDSLGFTLEPNPTLSPPKETPPILPTCESPKPLARLPALLPTTDAGIVINSNPDASESPCQLGSSSIDQHDPNPSTSRALVPAVAPEPLALVPHSGRKPRKTEASQRRIRRPFSVVEVEALVQAVEKLGTGRWRDVKLRAFDDAKHRTYVDLKDKWKTLVHTARISPQQRRGEPVPQELLDRVLTAHAYWSQHQAKLQVKPTQPKVDRCPVQALTED